MGSTIAIIGFVIWPDLPRTQSLNHAIKTFSTVVHIMSSLGINKFNRPALRKVNTWNNFHNSVVITVVILLLCNWYSWGKFTSFDLIQLGPQQYCYLNLYGQIAFAIVRAITHTSKSTDYCPSIALGSV